MKKLILFFLTAAILFGASAGVSYVLKNSQTADAKLDPSSEERTDMEAPDADFRKPASSAGFPGKPSSNDPVAVRTKYVPEAEVAVHIASSLRERETAVKKHEELLVNRENNIELVFKDIRGERTVIDGLRKQVFEEMKAVEKQMGAVKLEFTKLDEQKQKVEQQIADLESRLIELQGVEHGNVKKMAEEYGLMEPEKAAKIFVTMVENGKMDTVVKVIGLMSQRQAAKVFAELPQRMAGDLMEKLKGFKPEKPPVKN